MKTDGVEDLAETKGESMSRKSTREEEISLTVLAVEFDRGRPIVVCVRERMGNERRRLAIDCGGGVTS